MKINIVSIACCALVIAVAASGVGIFLAQSNLGREKLQSNDPNALVEPVTEEPTRLTQPSPSKTIVIKTMQQLEARDRATKGLKDMDNLIEQSNYILANLKSLSYIVENCKRKALSTPECETAKADLLQKQSESIRSMQGMEELRRKMDSDMCIIDPSRQGCG